MPRLKTVLTICTVLVGAFLNTTSQANAADGITAGAVDDGLSPELVQALLAMDLDKEQRGPFAAELRKYSANLQAAIRRISRQRNPDQPQRIKRKSRSLARILDKSMRKILREDQWAAYEAHKTTFTQPPKIQTDSAEANAGIERGATGY